MNKRTQQRLQRRVIDQFLGNSAQHLSDGSGQVLRLPVPAEAREYLAMARTVSSADPFQARQYLRMVNLLCTHPKAYFPEGFDALWKQVEQDIKSRPTFHMTGAMSER